MTSSKPIDTKCKSDRYRDEPAGGSSSGIPLLDHSDEELPGYSDDIERGDGGRNDPPPFAPYRPVVRKITPKLGADTLTVSHDAHLNNDGEALYRWLKEESLIPPKPQVIVRGEHKVRRRNGDKTEVTTRTDFVLELNLEAYLLEGNVLGHTPVLKTVDPEFKTNRGGRWRTVASGVETQEQRTVRGWADLYCEDKSTLKEFIMKKSCTGWDLGAIKTRLENMIRATNYLGRISVQFPVLETRVEVYPSNRISRMRKHEGWRWFFYLTFLWIFAWPYLWFFTKRYHVAETVWNYSKLVVEDGQQRMVCVQSEEEWLGIWDQAIMRAARARRQGSVTMRDVDESRRGEVRMPNMGNPAIDGPLGFIAEVGAIANNMRLSRGQLVGWGGDEGW